MGSDLTLHQLSRSKAERGDFGQFLDLYASDKFPTGRRLREMMNHLTYGFRQAASSPRLVQSHRLPAGVFPRRRANVNALNRQ